jgi:hypothetical protein
MRDLAAPRRRCLGRADQASAAGRALVDVHALACQGDLAPIHHDHVRRSAHA